MRRLTEEEKEIYKPFLEELEKYKKAGVAITLEGSEYSTEYIAEVCMVEDRGRYMGDYILDEAGSLVEIRFDKVIE